MLTLLGSLLGFFGSIFPDVLKMWQDRGDRSHELELFDRQLRLMKLGHMQRIEELEQRHYTLQTQALYRHAQPTGVKWVDALAGSVRPMITYTFFVLYAAVKVSQGVLMVGVVDSWNWARLLTHIWHEEDQALFAAVMSFWFGHRSLKKR